MSEVRSERLTAISKQQTLDRMRCEAMGFTLEESEVFWTGEAIALRGRMKCVCGRYENFNFTIELDNAALDPARLLRERGAFSVEHLEDDGYAPHEIVGILERGRMYDVAHP